MLMRFVVPPRARLVTVTAGGGATWAAQGSGGVVVGEKVVARPAGVGAKGGPFGLVVVGVELVMAKMLMPGPAVLVTTSVPLVMVMVLLVLAKLAVMVLAFTVPPLMTSVPLVLSPPAVAAPTVRPNSRATFTFSRPVPFTL